MQSLEFSGISFFLGNIRNVQFYCGTWKIFLKFSPLIFCSYKCKIAFHRSSCELDVFEIYYKYIYIYNVLTKSIEYVVHIFY